MENTENTGTQNPVTPNAQDDKAIGILSYLGLLWIVAYILYGSKKTEYNLFHVKQGLGLLIAGIGLYIVCWILVFVPIIGFLFGILSIFVYLGVLVLAILGIISAANGTQKELPLVGKLTASMLKNFK
ncbi:MAG: DUF4870 domain-containing protein [Bacteroidales bacterium]